jgi:hypothetical protein
MKLQHSQILQNQSGPVTVVYGIDENGRMWRGDIVEHRDSVAVTWYVVEEKS